MAAEWRKEEREETPLQGEDEWREREKGKHNFEREKRENEV